MRISAVGRFSVVSNRKLGRMGREHEDNSEGKRFHRMRWDKRIKPIYSIHTYRHLGTTISSFIII